MVMVLRVGDQAHRVQIMRRTILLAVRVRGEVTEVGTPE